MISVTHVPHNQFAVRLETDDDFTYFANWMEKNEVISSIISRTYYGDRGRERFEDNQHTPPIILKIRVNPEKIVLFKLRWC